MKFFSATSCSDLLPRLFKHIFILLQVYHDSDDGDRYIQFYHVTNFPHLAVLDPRTGTLRGQIIDIFDNFPTAKLQACIPSTVKRFGGQVDN